MGGSFTEDDRQAWMDTLFSPMLPYDESLRTVSREIEKFTARRDNVGKKAEWYETHGKSLKGMPSVFGKEKQTPIDLEIEQLEKEIAEGR